MQFRFATLSVVAGLLLATTAARADILSVTLSPLSSVVAGSTGNSFDVLLTNASGPPVSIATIVLDIVASSPDITLTEATTATGTPYVFGAFSNYGPDITGAGSSAQNLQTLDIYRGSGTTTLAAGTTVGLAHVLFDVSPTAVAQTVSIGFGSSWWADAQGNTHSFNTISGGQFSITTTPSTVPEGSGFILLSTLLLLLVFARREITSSSAPRS